MYFIIPNFTKYLTFNDKFIFYNGEHGDMILLLCFVTYIFTKHVT